MNKKIPNMENKVKPLFPVVKFIITKMKSNNWNAKDLSEKSGVSPSVISRMLHGSGQISIKNISNILEALGVFRIDYEIKNKDPQKNEKKQKIKDIEWIEEITDLLLQIEKWTPERKENTTKLIAELLYGKENEIETKNKDSTPKEKRAGS